MTNAFNYLLQGEFLRAILTVFTDVTSEPFIVFCLMSGFTLILFIGTGSAAFAGMVFITLAAIFVGSHLTEFQTTYGIMPAEFNWLVLLALTLAFAGIMWYAFMRKVN